MENNTSSSNGKHGFFSLLYRTRVIIMKGDTTILNVSILFGIISLLCAPWLVVIGALVALLLGYRFSIDRNAAAFDKDFENVVKDAASNVKNVVENVTGTHHAEGGQNDGGQNSGTDTGAQM
jgi:hypothetical protein